MGVGEGDGELGHHLGWDASDVEAGPAEGAPLLDAGGLEPELRGLDRRHVPSGPAAHHDHVALLARRRVRPPGGHGRPRRRRLRPPQHGLRRPPPRQDSERHLPLSLRGRFLGPLPPRKRDPRWKEGERERERERERVENRDGKKKKVGWNGGGSKTGSAYRVAASPVGPDQIGFTLAPDRTMKG